MWKYNRGKEEISLFRKVRKMRDFEKIKSIVYGKLIDITDDRDYSELAKELFGKELASDECRKRMYGMRHLLEAMEEEQINKITDNDIIKEIEDKKLELEKEKIRVQDQRREYKKYLRQDARFEHIYNTIKDEINKLN